MDREKLTKQHETKTIADLVHLYENNMLNLSPAFQRKSVWVMKDRQKLIDTIVRNYPLPAIFLYRNEDHGDLSYAVIDGKQRLETLLGFLGYLRGHSFEAKVEIPGMEDMQKISAKSLKSNKAHREQLRPHFMGYRIPVIEVAGPLSDIIEVFVRINSTGKPLTPQEQRKAKYSGSGLLVEATRLGSKLEPFWLQTGVISSQQTARMKHVEFAAELIVTMETGDVINKKAAVDKVMATSSITPARLKSASAKVISATNHLKRMFPELRTTRLKQVVDFYSLVVLIAKLEMEGAILNDKKRNQLAWDLLKAFSTEVDKIRESQRKLIAIKSDHEIYRDYLLTVSQMTDDVNQRRRREQILRGVIGSVFAKKDEQRGFSTEQRRILWNTSSEKKCTGTTCGGVKLDWSNFTIDHVDPHSKGGRSDLDNAALMCKKCNSAKGNRHSVSKVRTRAN
jgi:5-methylcytosine-specific restriction endonuclease McrA